MLADRNKLLRRKAASWIRRLSVPDFSSRWSRIVKGLASSLSVPETDVTPALPYNLISECAKCNGGLATRNTRNTRHCAPTAALPISSPLGSGISSPFASISSIVSAIASRALARASSAVSPWL